MPLSGPGFAFFLGSSANSSSCTIGTNSSAHVSFPPSARRYVPDPRDARRFVAGRFVALDRLLCDAQPIAELLLRPPARDPRLRQEPEGSLG